MNKNLIEGRRDGVSWHNTAKPTGEVVEVNQAVVRGRTVFLPGEASAVRAGEESAEVIVVAHYCQPSEKIPCQEELMFFIENLQRDNPDAQIVVAGDFNSNHEDASNLIERSNL